MISLMKISQLNHTISGPEVDSLINIANRMLSIDTVSEWNGVGLNKIDYGNMQLRSLAGIPLGTEVPVKLVVNCLNVLMKYKKQNPQMDSLYLSINKKINEKTGFDNSSSVDKSAQFLAVDRWKNVYLRLNGIGNKELKEINNLVDQEKINKNINLESWKIFYKAPDYGVGAFRVRPDFLKLILDHLSRSGWDVSNASQPSQPSQDNQPNSTVEVEKPQQNANSVEATYSNNNLEIKFPYNKNAIEFIKGIKSRRWDGIKKTWTIDGPTKEEGESLVEIFEKDGIDSSSLKDLIPSFLSKDKVEEFRENEKILIRVSNIYASTKGEWDIGISYSGIPSWKSKDLGDTIKFMFPEYGKERSYDTNSQIYKIKSDYNRYRAFTSILVKYNFNTNELNRCLAQLIKDNVLLVTRVEGDLDGYQKEVEIIDALGNPKKVKINNKEAFMDEVESHEGKIIKNGKEIDFKFYDKQKEDIAFLYGRQHSILGAETGYGKSLVAATAANMRLKQNGGMCLIITLPSVQLQFGQEITNFFKLKDEDISYEPSSLKKWTILAYSDFSTKGTRDETARILQEAVKSGKITCIILDEVHSVKNDSYRTELVQSITNFEDPVTKQFYKIPYVWGLSASPVANTPKDFYNQLKVINHPLGNLSEGTFNKEFGAQVSDGRFMKDASLEDQIEAATKLKEWLINYKVFTARTKKDVREDLPELIKEEVSVNIDNNRVMGCVKAKLETYKDPELPISGLIALRNCLAVYKVPETIKQCEPIIAAGKRILVFTSYKDSYDGIVSGLKNLLSQYGGGDVVGVKGGQQLKTRKQVVDLFKDTKSNAKALVVMIQAGGTGLDCPNVVEDVVFNDYDWTPASDIQATGRAFRINSNSNVHTKYVIAGNTKDRTIRDKVLAKIKIAEIITKLTQEQIDLLNSGIKRTDVKMKEVEQKLTSAVKEQMRIDEESKHLESSLGRDILDSVKDF